MEFVVLIGLMVAGGWIAAIVVCFLKGQRVLGVASISASGLALALNAWLLVQIQQCPGGSGDSCSSAVVVYLGIPVMVAMLLLVPFSAATAIVGASGLARPDSWWATHRYTPAKLQAAHDRYGKSEPATTPTQPT